MEDWGNGRIVERFVAVGDSTTEGVGDELPTGEPQGWADRFATALALRQGGLRYANLAIRGRRTAEIRAEQAAAAVALQPDLITAVVGVNDLVAAQFDSASFEHEVDQLFATLCSGGARVLSATLPDLAGLVPLPRRMLDQLRRRHGQVNGVLRARAGERGVLLLELDSIVDAVDRRVWRPDRLHPNPVGHALLAQGMLQLLDGQPVAVSARSYDGYGSLPYARAGMVWSAAWAGRYLVPRTVRRLRGRSSGDGRTPKFAEYIDLPGGPG
jgi:lysophospholipase L1-like esterase